MDRRACGGVDGEGAGGQMESKVRQAGWGLIRKVLKGVQASQAPLSLTRRRGGSRCILSDLAMSVLGG